MGQAVGKWSLGVILGLLVSVAGLGGCAMCGACYDECYPGYTGSCEGGACRGFRAGSIRAMGLMTEEEIPAGAVLGQGAGSGVAQRPEGAASAPPSGQSSAEGVRWANRPIEAAAPPPPSYQNVPQGKPFSTRTSPPPGQKGWPSAPSGRAGHAGTYPGGWPPPGGPLSLLSHWHSQPNQTLPGQPPPYPQRTSPSYPSSAQNFVQPPGSYSPRTTPSDPPYPQRPAPSAASVGAYSSRQMGGTMSRRSVPPRIPSQVGSGSHGSPGPGVFPNGPAAVAGQQAAPSPNPSLVSQNPGVFGEAGQPPAGQGGVRAALGSRTVQSHGQGFSARTVPRATGAQAGAIPPDVWAAIPPEDRPTAQILSITDRKMEPAPNPPEPALSPAPQPASQGMNSEASSGLQWLPAAPLPPGDSKSE